MSVVSFLLTTLSVLFYLITDLFNGGSHTRTPNSPNPIVENTNVKIPVCVVGAGISGLNVATLLQNRGYLVRVFEKKGTVGGKMITYREGDDILVEMAPLFFTQSSFALLKKINEHQLTQVPYNQSGTSYLDAISGKVYPMPSLTSEQMSQLQRAVAGYAFHHSQFERELNSGYTNASPNIFVPIGDWLSSRNLTALNPIFTFILTVQGYGSLEDVPTLYVLKFMSPQIVAGLGSSTGSFFVVQEGLDVLAHKMASPLSVSVNTEIIQISREGLFPTIVFGDENSGGYNTQQCKAVILAFPPLLPNLEKVIVDLNQEEINVLDDVKIHRYTSAAHHIPSFDQTLSYDPNPKGDARVVGLVNQSTKKRKNVYSSYSWIRGDFNSGPTAVDLLRIENYLQIFLKNVDRNSKTLYRTALEYFPHVGTKALNNGFYRKFNSIQGNGGLFYATTLLSFETMTNALEMTEAFVEKYF